jgi:hypothetical protein
MMGFIITHLLAASTPQKHLEHENVHVLDRYDGAEHVGHNMRSRRHRCIVIQSEFPFVRLWFVSLAVSLGAAWLRAACALC